MHHLLFESPLAAQLWSFSISHNKTYHPNLNQRRLRSLQNRWQTLLTLKPTCGGNFHFRNMSYSLLRSGLILKCSTQFVLPCSLLAYMKTQFEPPLVTMSKSRVGSKSSPSVDCPSTDSMILCEDELHRRSTEGGGFMAAIECVPACNRLLNEHNAQETVTTGLVNHIVIPVFFVLFDGICCFDLCVHTLNDETSTHDTIMLPL